MHKHHEQSIENMKEYYRKHGALALILTGSVAKGTERADSDLDGVVILSEEEYAEKEKNNTTTETIDGLCTYEGGYFDIKYMTKEYLKELAKKGSEPARNGFTKARILFCNDADIEDILSLIPVFQKTEKKEKLLSFYSDFWLNYYYFLQGCPVDGYMKLHAVGEVIYSIYRMVLQENEILFPCNRRLEDFVARISAQTDRLVSLGKVAARSQDIEDVKAFVEYSFEILRFEVPSDLSNVLSRYAADFEQWWRVPRPNVNEW